MLCLLYFLEATYLLGAAHFCEAIDDFLLLFATANIEIVLRRKSFFINYPHFHTFQLFF